LVWRKPSKTDRETPGDGEPSKAVRSVQCFAASEREEQSTKEIWAKQRISEKKDRDIEAQEPRIREREREREREMDLVGSS
jgi:hypothetical protein